MKVVKGFMFCILVAFVQGRVNWQIINNDHTTLGEAAALLTRRFFGPSSSTVVIIERSFQSEMRFWNTRILEHILTNLQERISVQLYNGRSEYQPWEYHIFVVDSIEAFDNIKWSFSKTSFERDFRFLIILTKYTADYMETLKRIFESCHRFHVFNANVILNHPQSGVCMFKYDLFTQVKCHEVQPYLYFRFKDGLHTLVEVFPQNLLNLWGCPLRITAQVNAPVLTFSGNYTNPELERNWDSLGGIEGEMIKMLSHTLNFTIVLLPIPNSLKTSPVHKFRGCFADLLEERADIAIGGFSGSHPRRYMLTPSIIYHQTPVKFVVRGGRELDSISRLGRPFSREVWNRLAICLLLLTLALLLLRAANTRFQNFAVGQLNRYPILDLLAVFMGYPIVGLPLSNVARYFLTVWLLMTLVIRNAYQGSLFDAFRTDQLVRIPYGYDDLIKWNYVLLGIPSFGGLEIYPKNRTEPLFYDNYKRLEALENTSGHYAVITVQDTFVTYLADNYKTNTKLQIVPETVYLHTVVLYFQKQSIYATSINKYLNLFKYAGVLQHISSNHVKGYLLYNYYRRRSYIPQPITVFRILAVFQICTVLLLIAVLVFVLELLSVYCEQLQFLIDFVN